MVNVNVINGLPKEKIVVKEGNGGVYTEVATIKPGGSHSVSINLDATYREFVCVESMSKHKIIFNSDDCMEYKEVNITGINESELIWKPTMRKPGGTAELVTDANIGKAVKAVKSFVPRQVTNLLTLRGLKKKNPSPQGATSGQSAPGEVATPGQGGTATQGGTPQGDGTRSLCDTIAS